MRVFNWNARTCLGRAPFSTVVDNATPGSERASRHADRQGLAGRSVFDKLAGYRELVAHFQSCATMSHRAHISRFSKVITSPSPCPVSEVPAKAARVPRV